MPRRPARTDGGRTAHARLSRDGDRRHALASGGLQRDRGLHRAAAKLRGAPLRSVALGLVQPATSSPVDLKTGRRAESVRPWAMSTQVADNKLKEPADG